MSKIWVDAMNESDPIKKEEILLRSERLNKANPIDLHFTYNTLIDHYYKARNENPVALEMCIKYCVKDIELFPKFKDASIEEELKNLKRSQIMSLELNDMQRYKEYENRIKDFNWISPRIPSFQRLAIIYDRQQRFDEAIEICKLALEYGLDDGTKGGFKGRIERLSNKASKPITPKKTPSKKAVKQKEVLIKNTIESTSDKAVIKGFMITFSNSTSKNFDRALHLAKNADDFQVTEHNNQTIYQAVFFDENHLNFIALYELIGNWKSTFVFKDGKMVDRKTLGQINYCYGDKLRSGDNSFCYGASMFTENPFGCHRLMIHSGQKPWYKWISSEDKKYIYINKQALRDQIDSRATTFNLCPAFDYENIINVLNDLPDKINKQSDFYSELYDDSFNQAFTIEVDINRTKAPIHKKTNKEGFLSKLLKLTRLSK